MNLIQNQDKSTRIIGLYKSLAKLIKRSTSAALESEIPVNNFIGVLNNWR